MLLDERQAAINELLIAYQESNDHYADAAEQIDDATLDALFARIRAAHVEAVERLCAVIRDSGELPSGPRADREEMQHLFSRLKGMFAEDRRRTLLEERIADERRIETLIETAAEADPPPDLSAYLDTLRKRQGEFLTSLQQALETPRDAAG